MQVERIFHNRIVFAVNSAGTRAQVIALSRGAFLAVGSDLEIKGLTGPGTEIVDLRGRMVLPGIVDVHNHHLRGGQADRYEQKLLPTMIFEAIIEAVRARWSKTPNRECVFGGIGRRDLVEWIGQISDELSALALTCPSWPRTIRRGTRCQPIRSRPAPISPSEHLAADRYLNESPEADSLPK
jgi:predicted amidohydrolase YtcJ